VSCARRAAQRGVFASLPLAPRDAPRPHALTCRFACAAVCANRRVTGEMEERKRKRKREIGACTCKCKGQQTALSSRRARRALRDCAVRARAAHASARIPTCDASDVSVCDACLCVRTVRDESVTRRNVRASTSRRHTAARASARASLHASMLRFPTAFPFCAQL
jgi:hypothetical protein